METVYLQLGSNLGDRAAWMHQAIELIGQQFGEIKLKSSVYETAAWGVQNQQNFLNQVIQIHTTLTPIQILQQCQAIETELGRTRTEHWGARTMDIDILFISDKIIDQAPQLIVPHPYIAERKFVLQPLEEIAPEFIHPIFKQSISQLLYLCKDQGEVRKI